MVNKRALSFECVNMPQRPRGGLLVLVSYIVQAVILSYPVTANSGKKLENVSSDQFYKLIS